MIASTLLPLLTLSPLPAAPPGPPVALVAPDEDEKPDKRPEVKEALDTLAKQLKQKGKQDDQAVATIDRIYQEFEESGPKDRASIVKGLEKCFSIKRRELGEGRPDNRVFTAAAVALKDMAPESIKPLTKLVEHKDFRDNLAVRRRLILSLGETQHEDAIKPLRKLLTDHHAAILAAASEALGQFSGEESDTRKDIFEEVLKKLMSAKSAVDTDPNDLIARDRYDVVAGPMITSLQSLSGHDERDPHAWQSWWNNNKKRNWDKD